MSEGKLARICSRTTRNVVDAVGVAVRQPCLGQIPEDPRQGSFWHPAKGQVLSDSCSYAAPAPVTGNPGYRSKIAGRKVTHRAPDDNTVVACLLLGQNVRFGPFFIIEQSCQR